MISSYEYSINEFVSVSDILNTASAERINLTAILLGMLVQDVWEGKVKRQKKDHGSRFLNLKKRLINEMHRNDIVIHKLNDATIENIRLLCGNRPGWIFNSSLPGVKSVSLTRLVNHDRREALTFDVHHLTMELKIDMKTMPSITISTW